MTKKVLNWNFQSYFIQIKTIKFNSESIIMELIIDIMKCFCWCYCYTFVWLLHLVVEYVFKGKKYIVQSFLIMIQLLKCNAI